MSRRRAAWAALAWAAFVLAASVMPTPAAVQTQLPLDKVFHGLFYLPLGALIFFASGRSIVAVYPRATVAALAAGLYGLALEVVQYFLPWRSFEWADAVMDLFGGVVGAAVAAGLAHVRAVRAKNVPDA